jgi:hypothetical protein
MRFVWAVLLAFGIGALMLAVVPWLIPWLDPLLDRYYGTYVDWVQRRLNR